MSFTSWPSPPVIAPTCFESLQGKNLNLYVSQPFFRIGNFGIKESTSSFSNDARKVGISSRMVPGHLEGSCKGKKTDLMPSWKLENLRTLLIDNYDSYTYNVYQELSIVNGVPPVVVRNDEWSWEEICPYLYEKRAFDNIVISPGAGSPTCPGDIGVCLRLLLECRDIPILGVCLGHQALGFVHGAQIVHAAEPVHGHLSEIRHSGGTLFHDIPSGRNSGFKVVRYNSLVIDAETLPRELIPIACWASSTDTLPFFGNQNYAVEGSVLEELRNGNTWLSGDEGIPSKEVLMGIRHSIWPHYGLQRVLQPLMGSKFSNINFRKITKDYWGSLSSSSVSNRKDPDRRRLFKDIPGNTNFVKNADEAIHYNSCLANQVGGARNIFFELFGQHKAENSFWLDSSSTEKKSARFSFMGGKGGPLWKRNTKKCF